MADMFSIRTRRLILRDLTQRDVPHLNEFFTDPRITRYMRFIKTRSLRETRAWVKRAILHNRKRPRDAYSLAVVSKKDRKVVGWIGFGSASEGKEHIGERDFGYAFRRDSWGQGFATESLSAIVDYIFGRLKGRSLFGENRIKNPSSGRVMEKCGFRRLPRRVRGMFPNHHCYVLTRKVWLRRSPPAD